MTKPGCWQRHVQVVSSPSGSCSAVPWLPPSLLSMLMPRVRLWQCVRKLGNVSRAATRKTEAAFVHRHMIVSCDFHRTNRQPFLGLVAGKPEMRTRARMVGWLRATRGACMDRILKFGSNLAKRKPQLRTVAGTDLRLTSESLPKVELLAPILKRLETQKLKSHHCSESPMSGQNFKVLTASQKTAKDARTPKPKPEPEVSLKLAGRGSVL